MERIHGNVISITLLVVLSFALAVNKVAAQSSLVRQQQALDMIAVFAEKLCKDIPLTGGGRSLELSGKAKAELSGIIKKIANLGVEGAAKYQTSEYRGLLQKDLAKAIKESTNCRLEVWKDLKDKLLGVAAPPPPPSPYDTATRVANAWHDAILGRDDATVRELTALPLAFDKSTLGSVRQVRHSYASAMRNMLDHPDGRAKLTFEEPMSILELFTDWNFSTDDAMMQHMSVRRKDIVVPLSVSNGGKGTAMIIVRPGNRFHVVRVWTFN